jgi:hypothetical protein
MARIGLVQTDGIGDIVIALPIARAFASQGDTVYWPVNSAFVGFLAAAAPYVNFIPVPRIKPEDYYYDIPHAELRARQCDSIYVLYSHIFGDPSKLQNKDIEPYLKFDEYKYAVAGVPFREKWRLQIERNLAREERLFRSLDIRREYICLHRRSGDFFVERPIPPEWERDYQIVEVDERTDSPFDWLTTFERAQKVVCIDSCFSNLVEQLNFPNEKYLILRSFNPFTPVLMNGWRLIAPPHARK